MFSLSYIIGFGYNNPIVSTIIAFFVIFVGSVLILKKRKNSVKTISVAVQKQLNELENVLARAKRGYYDYTANVIQKRIDKIRSKHSYVNNVIPPLIGVFTMGVPVYFLWLPLLIISLPLLGALAVTYPEYIRKFFNMFATKKLDS